MYKTYNAVLATADQLYISSIYTYSPSGDHFMLWWVELSPQYVL